MQFYKQTKNMIRNNRLAFLALNLIDINEIKSFAQCTLDAIVNIKGLFKSGSIT